MPADGSRESNSEYSLWGKGWPVSMSATNYDGEDISTSNEGTISYNDDEYPSEQHATYMEYANGVPFNTESILEHFFYENGNLTKIEDYRDGSSSPHQVFFFEYYEHKPNYLKLVTNYGYGFDLALYKPQNNLVSKVEIWMWDYNNDELKKYSTTNYTYTINTDGLPTEAIERLQYEDSIFPDTEFITTYKFAYQAF